MQVKPSERKATTGTSEKVIGYGKGPLVCVNPDLAKKKELYGWADKEEEKEISYTGTDKNGNDWSRLVFVFLDEITKKYCEYGLFISEEVAEFETGEGEAKVKKCWWINQWGMTQLVDDEKNLFRSFTHIQKQNEESKEWEDVIGENGEPVKLIYRQAFRGETSLYKLLRMLVTQDWFAADQDTNLFVKTSALMRGAVKDISMYIGTETFQDVIWMMYVEAKDTEKGIQYSNNCIDGAWLPGWKIKDVNINTTTNTWNKLETRPKGKGSYKLKDMHEFYTAVKRNRNMWEFAPLHTFSPDSFVQAQDIKFVPVDGEKSLEVNDASY